MRTPTHPNTLTEEFEGLEQNILRDGCLDALKVWRETKTFTCGGCYEEIQAENLETVEDVLCCPHCGYGITREEFVLIDGHNRYAICQKHGLPFDIVELSFSSRNEAYNWIIDNQLSRRNITPEQASYLRGKRYLAEKRENGGNFSGKNQYTEEVGDQNDPQPSTAEKLAEEFNVSAPTIKRDAKFAEAVDLIAMVSPEMKGDIPNSHRTRRKFYPSKHPAQQF